MHARLFSPGWFAAFMAVRLVAQPLPPPVAGGVVNIEVTVGAENRTGQYDYQPPKPYTILSERIARARYASSSRTTVPGASGSVTTTFSYDPNYAADHPEVVKPIRGVDGPAYLGSLTLYRRITLATNWNSTGNAAFSLQAVGYPGSAPFLIEGRGVGHIFSPYDSPVTSSLVTAFYSADVTRTEGKVGSLGFGLPLPFVFLSGLNNYWTQLQPDGTTAVFHRSYYIEAPPGIGVFYPIGAVISSGTAGHAPGYQVNVEPLTEAGALASLKTEDWSFTGNFEPGIEPTASYAFTPGQASASKLHYKLQIQPGLARTINWSETFTPEGANTPSDFQFRSENVTAVATETTVHTIDPFDRFGGQSGTYRVAAFETETFDATLTADTNHDGKILPAAGPITGFVINNADSATAAQPYGLLVNANDDDADDIADNADLIVNGPQDLKDFSPVFLNIKQLLTALPPGAVCKLSQVEGALNFVYTNLTQATAFDYLNNPGTGFGPAFDQSAATATVQRITKEGVELSVDFIDRIRNQNQGVILIEDFAVTTQPLVLTIKSSVGTAIITLPLRTIQPGLAVDANRDGVITLASEDASDATSTDNPFRFWINDDVDRHHQADATAGFEGYDVQDDLDPSGYSGGLDWSLDTVPGTRDLEDWTRLWISVSGRQNDIISGKMAIGLKWVGDFSGGNTPAIKLLQAAESTGDALFLADADTAFAQIEGAYGHALVNAAGTNTLIQPTNGDYDFVVPAVAVANLSASNPIVHFLFEGCQRGNGQLTIVLLQNNSGTYTKIGTGGGAYLDLKDVKEMYERWSVGESNGGEVAPSAAIADSRLPSGMIKGFAYPASLQSHEQNQYILYVHGWNMEPWEKDAFAETAFKRLYWQGYKGRFGTFQWPTTYGDAFDAILGSYDKGEYVAWQSAAPLAAKLVSLSSSYGGSLFVFAHSMGNVVTGEALRLAAQNGATNLVKTYIACQAAVPGEAWDANLVNNAPLNYPPGRGPDTPDIYGNWLLSDHGSAAPVRVNFLNTTDYALNIWQTNETLKPDWYYPTAYYYASSTLTPAADLFKSAAALTKIGAELIVSTHTGLFDIMPLSLGDSSTATTSDRYKIMAFAAEPRSLALGAIASNISGFAAIAELPSSVWPEDTLSEAKDYSSHPWHSAEFRFDNMGQAKFWEELLGQGGFKLKP